jgi:hypothetical protein
MVEIDESQLECEPLGHQSFFQENGQIAQLLEQSFAENNRASSFGMNH